MPPNDLETQFHLAAVKALARLIAAHELGSGEAAVVELRRLLTIIADHGTVASRGAEALARAIDRLGG